MTLYTNTGSLDVTVSDTTGKGLYSSNGSLRVTLVSGVSYAGLYAADGSLNVTLDTTGSGLYHRSGAVRGSDTTGSGIYSSSGGYRMTGLNTPTALFSASEPGVWFDPSDLTTLYQDSVGTTPVTAPAQPVGLMLDKSGRGNHATQSTSGSRPTYGIVPATGRRNLLTYSQDLSNALGWTNGPISNGSRTGGSVSVSASEGIAYIQSGGFNLPAGTYTFSADVVCDQTIVNVPIRLANGGNPYLLVNMVAGVSQRITMTTTAAAFVGTALQFGIDARNAVVPGGSDATGYVVTFNRVQFEAGSTATAYQKVVTAFEVTEANVASLSYLSFDGIDDFMITPTITPATDKVQVFTGVRKLSDVVGVIAETTFSNGSFVLYNQSTSGWGINSRGTTEASASVTTGYLSPITNVLSGQADIASPIITLRVNGSQVAQSTSSQGTGNYLAYPMYIGRRGGTSLPFNGQMYGLITRFGANLDSATITRNEKWMGIKTGVTV